MWSKDIEKYVNNGESVRPIAVLRYRILLLLLLLIITINYYY